MDALGLFTQAGRTFFFLAGRTFRSKGVAPMAPRGEKADGRVAADGPEGDLSYSPKSPARGIFLGFLKESLKVPL